MKRSEIIKLWKQGFTIKQIVKEYIRSNKRNGIKITSTEAQKAIEPIIFKYQTELMKGVKYDKS